MRGGAMLFGWKLTNPYERYVEDYLNIWKSIENDNKLKKVRKFRQWYEYTQNISGKWYLQAVSELFKKNKLIKGELKILHRFVDLKQIDCPVAMIAGSNDDITPFEQVYALEDHVSTNKDDIFKTVIPGSGHIGVFMGTKSQAYWAEAMTLNIERAKKSGRDTILFNKAA